MKLYVMKDRTSRAFNSLSDCFVRRLMEAVEIRKHAKVGMNRDEGGGRIFAVTHLERHLWMASGWWGTVSTCQCWQASVTIS